MEPKSAETMFVDTISQLLRDLGFHPSQISESKANDAFTILGLPIPWDPIGPHGTDDALDAFRHAYSSAVATYLMNESASKSIGDWNEDRLPIPSDPNELDHYNKARNMDLWNNAVGREIGKTATSLEEIAQTVALRLNSGDMIVGLTDTRQWIEPATQMSISEKLDDFFFSRLGSDTLAGGGVFFGGGLGFLSREIAGKIANELRSLFITAQSAQPLTTGFGMGDPIVLDLDGDGVETSFVADGALFDHDGNGFAEQTGWVTADDGILVRDINADGVINDGKELFGDQTLLQNGQRAVDGFQVLADLDDNTDGKIDASDGVFSQLKVWRDFDGDGVSCQRQCKNPPLWHLNFPPLIPQGGKRYGA